MPLKEEKETPVAIKPQWSLGPIPSAAQPTKHKSAFKKRERERDRGTEKANLNHK